jgi:hypothetical protein
MFPRILLFPREHLHLAHLKTTKGISVFNMEAARYFPPKISKALHPPRGCDSISTLSISPLLFDPTPTPRQFLSLLPFRQQKAKNETRRMRGNNEHFKLTIRDLRITGCDLMNHLKTIEQPSSFVFIKLEGKTRDYSM